jgi:hypothetical protein
MNSPDGNSNRQRNTVANETGLLQFPLYNNTDSRKDAVENPR